MLLSCFLLLFLCESASLTVTSWSTAEPSWYNHFQETTNTASSLTEAAEVKLSHLQVEATPDSTVSLGERVDLHCSDATMPDSIPWSWQRLENQAWKEVGRGRNLTLTQPEQSGLYRCLEHRSLSQERVGPNHTVYIISMHAAVVSKNLGIAAFSLSLLALIINIAILFLLCCQRLGNTTPNTAAEGSPGPEKSPKGGLPNTDSDRNVYMNYVNTKQTYIELNLTNMTGDEVYSSLS